MKWFAYDETKPAKIKKPPKNPTWEDLIEQFARLKFRQLSLELGENYILVFNRFEEICKPRVLSRINALTFQHYTTVRLNTIIPKLNRYPKPGGINCEISRLKTLFRCAHRWGMIQVMPYIEYLKVNRGEITCVSPEHFTKIFRSCHVARNPNNGYCTPGEWWQAYIAFQYMTGWRASQVLSIQLDHVDWDNWTVLSPWSAKGNKGKRDIRIAVPDKLQPFLEKLRYNTHTRERLKYKLFPYPESTNQAVRGLYQQYWHIQRAAGVRRCDGELYGYHDLRRGFATNNMDRLNLWELQTMLQHSSIVTTKKYVALHKRMTLAVKEKLFDPFEDQDA